MFQSLLNSDTCSQRLASLLQSRPPPLQDACRAWALEIAASYERGNKYESFLRNLTAAG